MPGLTLRSERQKFSPRGKSENSMSSRAKSRDLSNAVRVTQVGEVSRSEPDWDIARDDTSVEMKPLLKKISNVRPTNREGSVGYDVT